MVKHVTRRSFVAAGSILAAPALGRAQSALPERQLRIIVGFPNGGGSDLVARAIAPVLERRTGRRISIDNRPGNTGALAGEAIKKGPADGTMVALLPTTTLSSKLLVPAWPFNPLTDLASIMSLGTFQMAIALSSAIPPKTLASYVPWLKEDDVLHRRLGLPANDAFLSVYAQMVGRALGTRLDGVPFRGAAPMIAELQDGKIPAAYGGVTSFIAAHRGGRMKMVASSEPQRLAVAKEVPTAAELGYPGMFMVEWYGVFARTGTPEPIIDAWNKELAGVLRDREVRAQLIDLGIDVEPSTPQQCAARLVSHLARWRQEIESFGVPPITD